MQSALSLILSLFGNTGRLVLQVKDSLLEMFVLVLESFRAGLNGKWLNDAGLLVLIRQIYFTGVQPIGLALFVSLVSGSAIVNLIITALTSIDAKQMIGPVVVFLFLKELAPLLSSTIIFIRSGPAIVSELALMKINSEIQALNFMGIDTFSYLIFPRIAAVILSNYILSIFISFMALIGGFLVLGFVHYMRFYDYVLLLVKEIGIDDFIIFVLKVGLFGLLIAGATMHRAIQVERTFTSVPVALIRALVSLMIYMLLLEGLFAVLQTGL